MTTTSTSIHIIRDRYSFNINFHMKDIHPLNYIDKVSGYKLDSFYLHHYS